jgi:ankyrin repeat protein
LDTKKDRDKSNKKYEEKTDSGLMEVVYKKLLEDPISVCSILDDNPLLAKAKDTNGCLLLHVAASQPSIPVQVLEKIIQAYPAACEIQSEKGYTPLHFAVEAGTPTPNIKVLIKASPRALKLKDSKGQIPLHLAAYNNASVTSIRLLLFIYPDSIEVENAKGETARKVAKKKKANAEILSELKGGSSKQ